MTLRRPTTTTAAILLFVFALLGVASGILVNVLSAPKWEASTDTLVRTWTTDSLLLSGTVTTVTSQDQADAATVAVSEQVLTQAAVKLDDGRSWVQLAEVVTATPVVTSHFVTITASGRDSAAAQRTSQAVADAFAAVVRDNLSTAAASLLANNAGRGDPEVVLRSQLLTQSLQPIQVYRTKDPKQLTPSVQTPIALGVVGLAIAGLVLIVLYLARPTVSTARDAQRATERPAVEHGVDGGSATARLVARLRDVNPGGTLLICPIDAASEKTGMQLVEWIRDRQADSDDVRLLPEPTGAVLSPRPRGSRVSGLVLLVPRGTQREVVRDAVSLLDAWREVDAVIVTP